LIFLSLSVLWSNSRLRYGFFVSHTNSIKHL
jgi:hypothetical protein